ncbi:MAG: glycosyltransferase, partial [Cyclobacteriaceae bacterium]
VLEVYSGRFQVLPAQIEELPHPDLDLVITIPAYKEPDLLPTLRSLAQCERTAGRVEIILVINAPENSDEEVLACNDKVHGQVRCWEEKEMPDHLKIWVIREENLPYKHAGAGWARKIGMDEALRRWALLDKDGPIICLDADCTVSGDYLLAAKKAFENPKVNLAHYQFEHRIEAEKNPMLREGIIQYELHLRTYIQGLRWAGYPFAVHTVGSCMVCRASVYAKSGGMNRRKAGEDFYFIHKLMPLGGFVYLPAKVYPSCRISDRVPFGTGRAQLEYAASNSRNPSSYAVEVYRILKKFFDLVPGWFQQELVNIEFPPELQGYLDEIGLAEKVMQMNNQSSERKIFEKRFWQWMDGFKVLKMTHYLRDQCCPNQAVYISSQNVLELLGQEVFQEKDELLYTFREMDKILN